jgi:4-amino-4-deoxy-L-arabinose transferase-like glycosyltransferase
VDASRLRTGEIVAGGGGIAMFVFLFFDWFSGGAELTGSVGNLTVSHAGISGWDALTDLPGFLIILAAVSGIALLCLAAGGQRLNIPAPRGGVTATLGSLAVLLILWRMFAGSPTLKIGIFLGLAAAVAITVGALKALAEDGFQPFVAASAAPTRVAAASAPPANPAPPASTATKKTSTAAKKRSPAKKSSGTSRKSTSAKPRSSGGKRSSGSKKK